MTTIRFEPIPTGAVRALQAGGPDANGMVPERAVSDGQGNPCRHCLTEIPEGAEMLILAWRPFATAQPYAETGPVFLCADPCGPHAGGGLPAVLMTSPAYMMRGYGTDERIVYGTGGVVAAREVEARAAAILAQPDVTFVHVRSASNGCFQCAVRRG
ncbi:MAG: DUF1203 domain-containing protein [Pseudomonadota bacterium]